VHKSGVIEDYLAVLAAQLPPPVVEELADGLDQTRQRYLTDGLRAGAAADAAVAEFGDPEVILAAFTRQSPARRAARRMLAVGPVVGGSWMLALIAGRAWSWPVPTAGRILLGIALIGSIALLSGAAFGTSYRLVGRAAAAGFVGMMALDITMLLIVALAVPTVIWPLILAAGGSAARLAFTARTLRPLLAG
jgi:hypothetical protein